MTLDKIKSILYNRSKTVFSEAFINWLCINFFPSYPIVWKVWKVRYRSLSQANLQKKRVYPYAFIRAKNEIKTIDACLQSIIPVIDRGVIGYNESDDGTEEYILDFCDKHKGYIAYKYNYDVIPANDIRYTQPYDINRRLDYYYNAVLSLIPDGEWMIKIDCDQIYDTDKLRQLMFLPKSKFDCISIGRINLDIIDNEIKLLSKRPFCDPADHWLLKKTCHTKFIFKENVPDESFVSIPYVAWECLPLDRYKLIRTDILSWHFPLLKDYRNKDGAETIDLKEYKSLKGYHNFHIPEDMLDENRLYNIIKKFNI